MEIQEKLKNAVIKSLKIEESIYDLDLAVGDIPQWDSLAHVMLLQATEKEFGIVFDVGDAIDIESIADLQAMVEKYKSQ